MTYPSRKSRISAGLGSSSSLTSSASASSSSMISLQRSMHSSHMYTPGPAMSFLTCFCDLPQNEHFSRSPPSPMRATGNSLDFVRTGEQPGGWSISMKRVEQSKRSDVQNNGATDGAWLVELLCPNCG